MTTDRRTTMLVEGRRLILSQGYTATAVDAICDAAGVTKGAFFHHFATKDAFAAELLAHTWQPVVDFHETLAGAGEPRERLAAHIEFMANWIAENGRIMPLLAQELGASYPEIRSQIGGYFGSWMSRLDELLIAAAHSSKGSPDTTGLREFIVATTEGIPVVRGQFGESALRNVTTQLVAAVRNALDSSS